MGYIARRKNNDADAKKFLAAWIGEVPSDPWLRELLRFMHGETSAADLLRLADDNNKQTEAHAYIGESELFAGNLESAKTHFQWIADKGTRRISEYVLALAELRRQASPK